jgi:hypothetical protein
MGRTAYGELATPADSLATTPTTEEGENEVKAIIGDLIYAAAAWCPTHTYRLFRFVEQALDSVGM